jgi:hypothetical protein
MKPIRYNLLSEGKRFCFRYCSSQFLKHFSHFFWSSQPMVEVMAPAALAEGYQFPVTAANRTFLVTVPKGGCQARQTFSVPLPLDQDCIHPRVQVPVGHWKDGFWDLFQYGYCHVTVWNSCCCVPSEFCLSIFSARCGLECSASHILFPFLSSKLPWVRSSLDYS